VVEIGYIARLFPGEVKTGFVWQKKSACRVAEGKRGVAGLELKKIPEVSNHKQGKKRSHSGFKKDGQKAEQTIEIRPRLARKEKINPPG